MYTIHQLAELAHVTPRTLRHYDHIGLLKPSARSRGDYRLYDEKELLKLQQILFFRELEFPLEEIKRIMGMPHFNQVAALKDQRRLLGMKKARLEKLISTITKTIKHMTDKTNFTPAELYDAFKDEDVKHYQEEVQQRWGNTEAYKQSAQRVKKMTKAEMEKLKVDGKAHTQAIADAMSKGPSHPDVQALIAKSHEGINFFYDCSLEMFRNLGQMYVDDARFSVYYEKFAPGLAVFMREAITIYCDNKK